MYLHMSSKPVHASESVIRKWGNSPAVRLPTAALKAAGYSLEQRVEITVSPGRIVIEPSNKVQYDLDELLRGITKANAHDEVSFGRPVGKEAL
jgi:antitoxin MazE